MDSSNLITFNFISTLIMKTSEEITSHLQLLIEKNNDMHKQLIEVFALAENDATRSFFLKAADRHRIFSLQWVGVLKEINADASFDVEGSFSSALGRAWLDIKASLQMINDEVLLSAIEDSYEEIKQPYENLEIRHKKMDFLIQDHIEKIQALEKEIQILKG
ncbi:MAG: hypothetical protein CL596_00645 [Alteromonas sp.]|nr:hypothetical protein [Alteromonas sp.]MAY22422.1 hypothetical protein [Flavobacteriaceae bacterium]